MGTAPPHAERGIRAARMDPLLPLPKKQTPGESEGDEDAEGGQRNIEHPTFKIER